MVISLLSIFGLSIFLTCFSLAVTVSIFGKLKVHKIWAIFNLANAIWGLSMFFIGNKNLEINAAIVWWKIAHVSAMFISVAFLHTVLELCSIRRKAILCFFYIFNTIFFVVLNLINEMGYKLVFIFNSFYYAQAVNFRYVFATLSWFAAILYGFFILFREYTHSSGAKKNQIRYLLIPVFIAFLAGSSHFLPAYGINIYPFNIVMIVYPIIATYAILRYRLLDIRVFFSRAAAFLISYPLFLGVPFIFAYRMQWVLYPLLGANWWLAPSGLIVFFATLAPLAYGQLRTRMEEKLLSEQKRYQKLLLQAASGMATEHNLTKLSRLIVYIVKRAVRVEFAAIFIEDKDNGVYRMKAFRNSQRISPYSDVVFLHEHPFIKYLAKCQGPCLFEELPANLKKSLGVLSNVELIVPSSIQENLLGFVLLGGKLNKQHYSEDDINVFNILSRQAALAIENCLFMDETKQAQERIFAAEKLASIGGMADGVAHQIKNRLNQFSVASGELKYEVKDYLAKHPAITKNNKDLKKTLKYLTEIADSLIDNVKRTDGIVKGILNFARVEETSTFFSRFSLKEVVDLSTELLKIKHEIAEVPLDIKLGSSDVVYGVKAQITEAVYNLLDNAYEATQEKGAILSKEGKNTFTPSIKIKLTHKPAIDLLEISDNGIGMREESKKKIFAPFFTTKSSYKSGTGIGMYVVKRMVEENHKGKVEFSSTYMEGTKFLIQLPKK